MRRAGMKGENPQQNDTAEDSTTLQPWWIYSNYIPA